MNRSRYLYSFKFNLLALCGLTFSSLYFLIRNGWEFNWVQYAAIPLIVIQSTDMIVHYIRSKSKE